MKKLTEQKSDFFIYDLLTESDIKEFYFMSTDCNYFDEDNKKGSSERYSIVKEEVEFKNKIEELKNEDCYMLWYKSKMEALIAYNLFRNTGYAMLLYNLNTEGYCVLIEKDNFNN